MNQEEVWKDVKNYEGYYQVSSFGNIKSLEREVPHARKGMILIKEKILNDRLDRTGYLMVKLSINAIGRSWTVHQLVAMAFLNHIPCGHKTVVDHIDNNKLNNRADNLQLISQRENCCKDSKNKQSQYTGVYKRNDNNWWSMIMIGGKQKYLGTFKTELEAYQARVIELAKIETH